jgi:hypothetical protein
MIMNSEQAKREKQQRITDWWNTEGKAMWDARIKMPNLLDKEVFVIRFTRCGETYMPFVIIHHERTYSGERIALTISGLIGRTYEVGDGETRKTIASYSSNGEITGETLEEALYKATH